MKNSRIEKMLAKLFIVLCAIIVAFVITELISRLFVSTKAPLERKFPVSLVRKPKPYTMFGGTPNAIGLNNLGYPGKEPSCPKDSSEFRIIVLGGSTVFQGKPSIPELLEKKLHQNGFTNCKVYNFGVVSSVSGMELARMIFEIPQFNPDLVICYNGFNDIHHHYYWDPRPGYPFNYIVYENNVLLENDIKSYPTFSLLLYGSNIFRFLLRPYFQTKFVKLNKVRKEIGWRSEEWKNDVAETYAANLTKISRICKAYDIDFITFFQPSLCNKKTVSSKEFKKLYPDYKDYYLELFQLLLQKAQKQSKKEGYDFIDISDVYNNTEKQVYVDVCHTIQEYKPLVAENIYHYIVDNNKLNSK